METNSSWGSVLGAGDPEVLVAYASRHGSTAEIAEAIADELRAKLSEAARVSCLSVEDVDDVEVYDAVVLGSAVYFGRWLPEARRFLERQARRLLGRHVWLFSSGPVDDENRARARSKTDVVSTRIGAREHHVFGGRLHFDELSPFERVVTRLVHAVEGDYRDFPEIRRWASEIASQIAAASSGSKRSHVFGIDQPGPNAGQAEWKETS